MFTVWVRHRDEGAGEFRDPILSRISTHLITPQRSLEKTTMYLMCNIVCYILAYNLYTTTEYIYTEYTEYIPVCAQHIYFYFTKL